MSEAELHMMRVRLRGGILNQARRGELKLPLPVGLVYDPLGRVVLDPDAQVQHSLRLLFDTFTRTGSARATMKHFRDEKLRFPHRPRGGPHMGELHWRPLNYTRVLRALHNPRYAGAFAYGRTRYRRRPGGGHESKRLARVRPGQHRAGNDDPGQRAAADRAPDPGHDRAGGPAAAAAPVLRTPHRAAPASTLPSSAVETRRRASAQASRSSRR